jgi:hypothetical protein
VHGSYRAALGRSRFRAVRCTGIARPRAELVRGPASRRRISMRVCRIEFNGGRCRPGRGRDGLRHPAPAILAAAGPRPVRVRDDDSARSHHGHPHDGHDHPVPIPGAAGEQVKAGAEEMTTWTWPYICEAAAHLLSRSRTRWSLSRILCGPDRTVPGIRAIVRPEAALPDPAVQSSPLRPEAKVRRGLPALQYEWPAADRPCVSAGVHRRRWRLSLTSSLGRSRAGRERLLSPTRFPSLRGWVQRRSRASATCVARPEWGSPNGSGRRRMRLAMRLGLDQLAAGRRWQAG